MKGASSPSSLISRFGSANLQEKAELTLEMLVSILSIQSYHAKFSAALPLSRICLLLLSDKPTPTIAAHVLTLIGIGNTIGPSFSRKFELINGWSVLKTVIPRCWDSNVKKAAFDILLGRSSVAQQSSSQTLGAIACPNIVPTILSAMSYGLLSVASNCGDSRGDEGVYFKHPGRDASSLNSVLGLVFFIIRLGRQSLIWKLLLKTL